jgi:hypothetical protein
MEFDVIHMKQEIEKLKRDCFDKTAEILALTDQNTKLQGKLNEVQTLKFKRQSTDRNSLNETSEIIFQQESPIQGTQFMLGSARKQTVVASSLMIKTTEYGVNLARMSKFFEGSFPYMESPNTLIPISDWEFVIVCPNPDFYDKGRNQISLVDATKYFKKSFRPEFSRKLNNLRMNQQIELKAFENVFGTLLQYQTSDDKHVKHGGRFIKDGNVIKDTGKPAKDFLTLMRNVLLVKLGLHLGLHTKQVISSNGQFIYILVSPEESDLQNEAEAINYNLQMELGEVDIQSLEPCDGNLRPFRVLKIEENKIKEKLDQIKAEFPEIMDLFKMTESEENNYDSFNVVPVAWERYFVFLIEFQKGLREMKAANLNTNQRNVCLQKILRISMDKANEGIHKDFKLKNLWEHMGFVKPLSPYFDYVRDQRFKNIWKKYETQNKQKKEIFRSIDRLKLLQSLISRQADLHYLAQKEIIHSFFPLKNDFELHGVRQFTSYLEDPDYEDNAKKMLGNFYEPSPKGLLNNWGSRLIFGDLPITKIRNYFGEKIGLYFAFINYFSKVLSIPSFSGVAVFVLQRIYQPEDRIIIIANVLYCIYVSVWAAVFIEFWKRRENCLAIKWGQTDYEEDEVPRPQFSGTTRRSPIDDEMDDVYYNPNKRYKFFMFSILITSVFIGLVISAVLGIIVLRWQLTDELTFSGFDLAGPVCSSINAVQIQIFNVIFNRVATKLNNLENHRTQSDYESSLIIKSYVFQFVNSFFSLFYIGFFKSMAEGCIVSEKGHKIISKGASCMDELYTQFITIFTISFMKNGLELGLPYLQAKKMGNDFRKTSSENFDSKTQTSKSDIELLRDQIDKQIQLPAYITRDVDGTLGDYLELSILFGYITLFAVAFPLSGVLTFLAVVIEIYVDRYKLLYMVRRPIPMGAKNINNWKTIFMFNSIAAIVTNAAIICFTMPTFNNWESASDNKFLIYACFCIFMLFLRAAVAFGIPDIPLKYHLISKRHGKIVQRFIKGWEVIKTKGGNSKVYVNPNIYCVQKVESDMDFNGN